MNQCVRGNVSKLKLRCIAALEHTRTIRRYESKPEINFRKCILGKRFNSCISLHYFGVLELHLTKEKKQFSKFSVIILLDFTSPIKQTKATSVKLSRNWINQQISSLPNENVFHSMGISCLLYVQCAQVFTQLFSSFLHLL